MQLVLLWVCVTPGHVSFVQGVQKVLPSMGALEWPPEGDISHILRSII